MTDVDDGIYGSTDTSSVKKCVLDCKLRSEIKGDSVLTEARRVSAVAGVATVTTAGAWSDDYGYFDDL